jgi:glycosyltransferase involved in cell wall biosynthesis
MQGLVSKLPGKPVMVMPVGNVLRSRAELDAVWLAAQGQLVPRLPAPAGPAGRLPWSIFHYGLPAKGKGLERLLEALKLVRQAGCPAMLYLGGDFPPGAKLTEDLLNSITESGLAEAVVRLGHIPRAQLEYTAQQHLLGVFPFDEGYSSKRSSLAGISHCDLPLVVGGGSAEEHPYFAPSQNTAAALSVLLLELLKGRLEQEWVDQVSKQREYAQRFSFTKLAETHLALYKRMRRVDI